jgi:hypothetical protein
MRTGVLKNRIEWKYPPHPPPQRKISADVILGGKYEQRKRKKGKCKRKRKKGLRKSEGEVNG